MINWIFKLWAMRSYERMLSVSEFLRGLVEKEPRSLAQLFASLWLLNPVIANNPHLASEYLSRALQDKDRAGGYFLSALNDRYISGLAWQLICPSFDSLVEELENGPRR